MNDLFELYYAFIEHISMLKLDNSNTIFVSSISNAIELLNSLNKINENKTDCNSENEEFFINKMNNIFKTIKEKKNKSITDISSFPYFLKCLKIKSEDLSIFLNIYNLEEFNINLFEIGDYLQKNNEDDYNVFYNHFLLLYIEICNDLYEEENMVEDTKYHYNIILDKFTEDSFNNDNISENIIELILLIVNNIFKENLTNKKFQQIVELLNDGNLVSIIDKILKINMSEEDIEESNLEIKKLSKSDIIEKINFYMNKFNNINVMQLIQNLDLKNIMSGDISSLMSLFSSTDILNNIPDIMEHFPQDMLENLPFDASELLQGFSKNN